MSAKAPPAEPKTVAETVTTHNGLRDELKNLERAYGRAGRSSVVTLSGTADGSVVIKADVLNHMHAALNRQTTKLGRSYAKAYKYNEKKVAKKDKVKRAPNVNNGLIAAIKVEQPFIDFISKGGDRTLQKLTGVVTKNSFGSRTLLAEVIRRYVKEKGLVDQASFNRSNLFGQRNGQFFKADALLRKTFAPYFDDRAEVEQEQLRAAGVRDGDMKDATKPAGGTRNYFKKDKENKDLKPLANFNDYSDSRQNPQRLSPIYNDYYHALDLDNLNLTSIASVLAAAGAVSGDNITLSKEAAAEYGRQLETAGPNPDHLVVADRAASALGLDAGNAERKKLNLRGLIDNTTYDVKILD